MKLVALMNDDLALEFRSIVQYTQHIAIIKGPEFDAIVKELRVHLTQELEHAIALAEQIDFLGGVPTVNVPPVPNATDSKQALRHDLELEQNQLVRYRERVDQAIQLSLHDVAEVLRPLLQQTQEHVRDLQAALNL